MLEPSGWREQECRTMDLKSRLQNGSSRLNGSVGHSAPQLMTLDTEQNPNQLRAPINLTVASKVTDKEHEHNVTVAHHSPPYVKGE